MPVKYVAFDTAGKIGDAVKQGTLDSFRVGSARAKDIAFSAPYVQIEGGYLVPKDSPLRQSAISTARACAFQGDKTAYDLFLTRELKKATLVRAATSIAAVDTFRAQKLDAAAGVKNFLAAVAAKDPSTRVIDGSFMVIGQAAGVPNGRPEAAKYLQDFIEEMKASGFVARALQQSGFTDATVAPAAK